MGKVRDIFCGDKYKPVIDETTGEICCQNCGFVAGRDEGNIFGRKDSSSGEDYMLRHDAPLDTESMTDTGIGDAKEDFSGRRILMAVREHIKSLQNVESRDKLRARNGRIRRAAERLRKIGVDLKMSSAHVEEALSLYKAAQLQGIMKGRTFDSSVAASLMCILRKYDVPISFQEVAEVSDVRRKKIVKAYAAIQKNMKDVAVTELPNMSRYVSEMVAACRLPEFKKEAYRREVMDNIQYLRERGYLGGLKPSGVAAAVAYATQSYNSDWKDAISQVSISATIDVTMPTVRRGTKFFKAALDQLYRDRAGGKVDKPRIGNSY